MRVQVIPATELDSGLVAAWRRIQAACPSLAGPYFAPEFTQAVAAVRNDVYVGVIGDGPEIGLFPHQRRGFLGRPVGGHLSDYQGVVAPDEMDLDPLSLIRDCGLNRFNFDHLLVSQRAFVPWHCHCEPSYLIRLEDGYEAFVRAKKSAHTLEISSAPRHRRAIEREVGPLRFVPHVVDAGVLDGLLDWKRHQYRATHVDDAFAFPWAKGLMRRILETQGQHFGGMLSALYAGDTLVAAHFGMRTPAVWHYWILAYDHDYGRYSPGVLLLLEMLRHAAELNTAVFDLGKGHAPYKERLYNDTVLLAEGSCEPPSIRRTLRSLRRDAEQWVRRSPLMPIVRIPAKLVRRLEKRRIYG